VHRNLLRRTRERRAGSRRAPASGASTRASCFEPARLIDLSVQVGLARRRLGCIGSGMGPKVLFSVGHGSEMADQRINTDGTYM